MINTQWCTLLPDDVFAKQNTSCCYCSCYLQRIVLYSLMAVHFDLLMTSKPISRCSSWLWLQQHKSFQSLFLQMVAMQPLYFKTSWRLRGSFTHYGTYTLWPVLNWAQAGCRLVQLHLLSGPDWNQKFAPNTSSVCCILLDHSSVFQMVGSVQWNASGTQPSVRSEPSVACICYGMAKRKPMPFKKRNAYSACFRI